MEIRNIDQSYWYTSYMSDKQAIALIRCQQAKIVRLQALLDCISTELDLTDDPRCESDEMVIDSLKELIKVDTSVEYTLGYFKWEG